VIEAFSGVPGRLELIADVQGVKVYNDTTATTPEATLAALHALNDVRLTKSNIILIMGGADKGLDMNKLLLEIPNYTKRVIQLAGTGTNRVLEFLPSAPVFDNLASAVHEAFVGTVPGDIILFSPAFTSFGMFKNEYDRGDQFNALIQTYGN
jgi:UDP-N-acetylmuramoylalanine--D-glutamate ligase